MRATSDLPLNAYLNRVEQHLSALRSMDLHDEADLEAALETSRQVLGLVALYRDLLDRLDLPATTAAQASRGRLAMAA